MWLGNMLFGRPEERAYRIDVDVVRDVIAVLEDEYPGIEVQVIVTEPHGETRTVHRSELEELSSAELQRMSLHAQLPGWDSIAPDPSIEWQISLSREVTYFNIPTMTPPNAAGEELGPDAQRVAKRIRQRFADASWPILRRPLVRWNAIAVLVPLVVMTIAWLWIEFSVELDLPVHVLGWAAIAFVAMITISRYRFELSRLPLPRDPKNGHLVLGQTRRQTKADRAGSRRDLKVSLLSVGGTVAAAAILYFTLGIGR